jgi:hypothetical protein
MKTAVSVIFATAALSALSSAAWAAPAGRQDNSHLVIWAFLGFCALIVIAQVVPAILQARRAAAAEKEAREKEAASTYR